MSTIKKQYKEYMKTKNKCKERNNLACIIYSGLNCLGGVSLGLIVLLLIYAMWLSVQPSTWATDEIFPMYVPLCCAIGVLAWIGALVYMPYLLFTLYTWSKKNC